MMNKVKEEGKVQRYRGLVMQRRQPGDSGYWFNYCFIFVSVDFALKV